MLNRQNIICLMSVLMLTTSACSQRFQSAKNQASGNQDLSSTSNAVDMSGSGSVSVPTAPAVVARLQNGLQGNVSSLTGNFKTALTQVQGNLPRVTDPTKATGYDQVELLAYAACSDLTTGTTPKMTSKYNVPKTGTIAANQVALVKAGVQMLDQYSASLASQGPTSDKVTTAFNNLVQQLAGDSANTSTVAFMSVCVAANTAGSTLMGF